MRHERIIWGAIVFSTVIYFILVYTMAPNPVRPFEEAVRSNTTLTPYLLALAMFVAAMLVPKRLVSAPPRMRMIVALSLFEACAIFGLMAAFLQQDWRLFIPPWILAVIGFVSVWPREDVTSSRVV
ncbi:MAG TPA: hypothetical protein VEK79_20350 [Thermoanaerobaculia bacterium]|nr:hypothetical protein [Thermoanaerobaculia bacterium]